MDFKQKINAKRPFNQTTNTRTALESDRGRIINSAGLRRLQQKTQVFPLERNAAVRSRLTHSLEVQQNGRFIVHTIFNTLNEAQLTQYGLKPLERELESLVEMACLMHDIGNPAFGHFGEAAINAWFSKHLKSHPLSKDAFAKTIGEDHPLSPTQAILHELCHYEGNAQAIRNVHSLFALNLTYCQTASILKYTRCGTLPKQQVPVNKQYLMKKVGYYFSESEFIETLCNELGMKLGHRHPASYIMEAADDIAYCLADIEDAVEKGLITIPFLIDVLNTEYRHVLSLFNIDDDELGSFMQHKCEHAYDYAKKEAYNIENNFFIRLRVNLLHPLVKHSAIRFCDNIDEIFHGSFNASLLEDNSYQHAITKALKSVAFKYVFCHHEVQQLELQGHKIITTLLNEYACLLDYSHNDFNKLLAGEFNFSVESRLLNRISSKYLSVYKKSVDAMDTLKQNDPIYEFYYRARLIQDFIGNMTDQFAYDTYRKLMVIE